jgi:hypothetical protein
MVRVMPYRPVQIDNYGPIQLNQHGSLYLILCQQWGMDVAQESSSLATVPAQSLSTEF